MKGEGRDYRPPGLQQIRAVPNVSPLKVVLRTEGQGDQDRVLPID
jgi:hypothetical protein